MEAQAVRNSRAGDAFHYRWAARRCLALVDPNSPLRLVVIEGSNEPEKPGEYAIDLAEYSDQGGSEAIHYYQLKHSTVRTEKEFTFSEFRSTLANFARRFSALGGGSAKSTAIRFSLITNRRVARSIKVAIQALCASQQHPLQMKFERATELKGDGLKSFCSALTINDSEGDYLRQKEALYGEMSHYFASPVEEKEVDGVIALVADRALPKSDGKIQREDILLKLGVDSSEQLFPAPPQFEMLDDPIPREQQDILLAAILASRSPMIIHATGGVGKSIVARQLLSALPRGSWGLVYDCFGGGNYRNTSQSRHRPNDALVQMANEMAVAGLCQTLIPRIIEPSKGLFRAFLERVRQAIGTLRAGNPEAKLVLFIDAADNAETAASEAGGEICFVHALLRETVPEGCCLVALCRTERIHLLDPVSTVEKRLLRPFSPIETGSYLRKRFPEASDQEVEEFNRLSSGNPRVQANALAGAHSCVLDLLDSLGPAGTTVAAQIEAQLGSAIGRLKDFHPRVYGSQIDAICYGLANLPPFIPLNILAMAAGVDVETIKSFVSDLGRPLWLSDDAVQFRDEPTETWFIERFRAEKAQILTFITALEPLAVHSTYVARSLPQLLHRVQDYRRLVALALSDDLLPENNPTDARDIRLYRLQFAFKAALRLGNQADACRLALRAGEELAGDRRHMKLLADNVDIVPHFQSAHRVQELAYRSMLKSDWRGSANAHSAALLSSINDFKGEARSYLRGAGRWLELTGSKHGTQELQNEQASEEDFLACAWAWNKLSGPQSVADFFLHWKPSAFIFRAASMFARRLADANEFYTLNEIASAGAKQISLLLAVTDSMNSFGERPSKKAVKQGLSILARKKFQHQENDFYFPESISISAILSLCEAAAWHKMPNKRILSILDKYTLRFANSAVVSEHRDWARKLFLRGAALRAVLEGTEEPKPESLFAKPEQLSQPDRRGNDLEKGLKEALGALLPWYFLRARIISRDGSADDVSLEQIRNRAKSALYGRYRTHDNLPYEMSSVHFEVLALKTSASPGELEFFAGRVLAKAAQKFALQDRLSALRLAGRLSHLKPLRDRLEESCRLSIESASDDGPQERSGWYLELCRAVFADRLADAAAYFDLALEAVSRFGDEITERWNAVVAISKRATAAMREDAELTYRFIRCGEMVGRSVGREKYWDRDEVFRVAARMHPSSAFAALSRWRDRGIGYFGQQLRALANEMVGLGIISPECGWGLTGFLGCNAKAGYSTLCISRGTSVESQLRMLRAAIRDLELDDAGIGEFRIIEGAAAAFPDEKRRLAERIKKMVSGKPERKLEEYVPKTEPGNSSPINNIITGANFLDINTLDRAVGEMVSLDFTRDYETFWAKVLLSVSPGDETKFFDTFLAATNIDCHDALYVISHARNLWLKKASVERCWISFLTKVGERFAHDMVGPGWLTHWVRRSDLTEVELESIKNGMVKGLVTSIATMDASVCFGFVVSVVEPFST